MRKVDFEKTHPLCGIVRKYLFSIIFNFSIDKLKVLC
nr:MAG TPA: hypothetical protein [Caudoviricetes sp.]